MGHAEFALGHWSLNLHLHARHFQREPSGLNLVPLHFAERLIITFFFQNLWRHRMHLNWQTVGAVWQGSAVPGWSPDATDMVTRVSANGGFPEEGHRTVLKTEVFVAKTDMSIIRITSESRFPKACMKVL